MYCDIHRCVALASTSPTRQVSQHMWVGDARAHVSVVGRGYFRNCPPTFVSEPRLLQIRPACLLRPNFPWCVCVARTCYGASCRRPPERMLEPVRLGTLGGGAETHHALARCACKRGLCRYSAAALHERSAASIANPRSLGSPTRLPESPLPKLGRRAPPSSITSSRRAPTDV